MSNYQRINANSVALGENNGQPSLKSANDNKLKVTGDIVANDNTPVITYTDSSNTIDFHNKPVVNFSGGGGGGGGDAFLNGGTALVTPQEFTGFNRFDNDTQFKEGVVFSDNGIDINGRIHASASQLHLQTNNVLDTISMKLAPAGSTNTLELKQDPNATTQNALFIQQVAGSSTLEKVLTDSTQDLGVIVDAVEASPNTFTNTNTFSAQTTTSGITNSAGLTNSNGMVNSGGMTSDVMTCQGLLSTQSLTASQTITGTTLVSNGNITCGSGTNLLIGGSQISSSDLFDSSSIVKNTDTSLTIGGQIQGDTLISTNNITSLNGGIILNQGVSAAGDIISTAGNMEARGGQISFRSATAKITDDVSRNLTITAPTALNKIYLTFDGTAYEAMRVDIFNNKGRIQLWDYGRADYYDVGQNPDDIAGIIALLNNTSLTFNPTTTLSAQGTFIHIGANASLCGGASNGTLSIGNPSATDVVNIEASVNFDGTNTTTFNPNSTLLLNGTTTLAGGVIDICKSGVSYGVFGKLASLSDRSDTDLNPTRVNPTLVSPLTASVGFQAPTYVYNRKGTNGSSVPIYEVVINGNVTKATNWDGNGDQIIFTLPVNFRPSGRITYRAQGRGGRSDSRIDILTTGEVLFVDLAGSATTYTELSLSGISFYANI